MRRLIMGKKNGTNLPKYLYDSGTYENGLNAFQIKGYRANSYSRQARVNNPDSIYWYMTQSAQIQQTLSSTTSVDMSGYTKLHVLADWVSDSLSRGKFYVGIASNIVTSGSIATALPDRIEHSAPSTATPSTSIEDAVTEEIVVDISASEYLNAAWLYFRMSCGSTEKIATVIHKIWLT